MVIYILHIRFHLQIFYRPLLMIFWNIILLLERWLSYCTINISTLSLKCMIMQLALLLYSLFYVVGIRFLSLFKTYNILFLARYFVMRLGNAVFNNNKILASCLENYLIIIVLTLLISLIIVLIFPIPTRDLINLIAFILKFTILALRLLFALMKNHI